MTVLITGGAGFVGSHFAWCLADAGIPFVVLDNLSTGNKAAVPAAAKEFVEADMSDTPLVIDAMRRNDVRSVVHFAASILVDESMKKPIPYLRNNVSGVISLMDACAQAGVREFVFSSTSAVYGQPSTMPIAEDIPLEPINNYGWSKMVSERLVAQIAPPHDIRHAVMRCFNVAGADPALRTGENRDKASHLINVATQVALGLRDELVINGTDYPTPDGSCIRDYVHACDLADAHLLLLQALRDGKAPGTVNCGYGRGYSVLEVVSALEDVLGRPIPRREGPRREGDPAALVGDTQKLRDVLDFKPRFDDLHTIIETALAWEEKRRDLDRRQVNVA